MLPRSAAERLKTDRSIAELLRLSNVDTTPKAADPRLRYRRAARRTADEKVFVVLVAAGIGAASWTVTSAQPVWLRVLVGVAIAAVVLQLLSFFRLI